MTIPFSKYHGAGNDFVLIDGREIPDGLTVDQIGLICHRRFGIGADGIIVIAPSDKYDFEMLFYNSDGTSGAMCSNGSRCALHFAGLLGYPAQGASFSCCTIPYAGRFYEDGSIGTSFPDLIGGELNGHGYLVDTGAPHQVIFQELMSDELSRELGRSLRYHADFEPHGVNVNFVAPNNSRDLLIKTYERGVEDLTLACGTGALAAAIAYAQRESHMGQLEYALISDGGTLIIEFDRIDNDFRKVEVRGPAVRVFSSVITL